MNILNVGCGSMRLPPPFINLDNLRTQLPLGTPEREALDREPNYIEHDIFTGQFPFHESSFSGVMLFHCLEHFSAQSGLKLLQDCFRVVERGGSILVSVPDASYFREVYSRDRNENWLELFEVLDPPNPIPTWFEAALWFEQHEAILTEDSLWAYLIKAGFRDIQKHDSYSYKGDDAVIQTMHRELNRRKFSLVMSGRKPE